jgi:hypothetical protein
MLSSIRVTPTSISGGSSVASGGVDSPSEGSMVSFSLPSSLPSPYRVSMLALTTGSQVEQITPLVNYLCWNYFHYNRVCRGKCDENVNFWDFW